MEKAMLDFHVDLPNGELTLLADTQSVVRLLSILLENASKYTPPGGSVTLCSTPAGERIVLSVLDTGIGIAPEDQLRIFDRFYRASPTGNAAPAGSGLGLALAKWIAERHDSKLTVTSEPGQGSCFSFSLQLLPATRRDAPLLAVTRAD